MVPDSFYALTVEARFAMLLMVDSQSTAQQRAQSVKAIREMPYTDFLNTAYWKTIRDYVIRLHPHCKSCRKGRAIEVHHVSYRHHGEEHLHMADLMPVCRLCHEILQEKFDNVSRSDVDHAIHRCVNLAAALKVLR